MNKLLKIIITVIISIMFIVVLVFGIKIVFFEKADIDTLDYRVSLYNFEPTTDYDELLKEADLRYRLNEQNADSAPKQTVVTLWNIMDTQSIIVLENKELLNQNNELAKQNDSIIRQNEILINNQLQTQTLLILLLISILVIGISLILSILWGEKREIIQ